MAEGKKKTVVIIGLILVILGIIGLATGVYNNVMAEKNVAMAGGNATVERPSPFPQIGGALALIAGVITMAAGAKKD